MRTKHLFYTAAMAALFAACVNDDFETIGQQGNVINDGRPVVSDVKLKFTQGGADTRLVYEGQGKGYAWQTNDTIGALLMDNVVAENPEQENLTWLEKYQLVDDIHTSYPFTYSTAGETWGCNTKMLEGNYFFAYPWEDYKGERRVKHSLTNQSQQGVGAEVRAKSYAENQFFIGYSQIMAGTSDKDVLNEVEMVPVLGAIQLQIVNTGTQTYHINKVVLKGDQLHSTLTFDPTNAEYETWNLEANNGISWVKGKEFNYANYTGNEEDIYAANQDYVYNITGEEAEPYERNAALRAVINEDPTTTDDDFAQIIIKGTEAERALVSTKTDEDAVGYVLIMANAVEKNDLTELTMDIYTDEGIVRNINLMQKNTGTNGQPDKYEAITTSEVKAIGPSVVNTIGVQIDDNSFLTPDAMDIYTEEDLLQFIQWNVNETGAQNITATLVKPGITLTEEMAELLAKNTKVELTIKNDDNASNKVALVLAEELPANILNYENLTIETPVNVLGTINISAKSDLPKDTNGSTEMTIEEGAVLNINDEISDKNNGRYNVVNKGTVNIAAKDIAVNGSFTNYAAMTIGAGADVKATVKNEKDEKDVDAVITNNGFMQAVENGADAVINLGKGGIIASGTNAEDGIIRTAEDAQVSLSINNGDVIYVDGAAIVVAGGNGDIAYEAEGTINDALYAELKGAKVTKLIIDGAVSVTTKGLATEPTTPIFNKIVAKAGSLVVDKNITLNTGDLTVEESLTTGGAINVTGKVTVNKDAILTNNGTISSVDFTNYGRVNNNGAVNVENALEDFGDWMYNEATDETGKLSEKDQQMLNAVTLWMNNWENWYITASMTQYYNGNPRDLRAFANALAEWERLDTKWISDFKKVWNVQGTDADAYEKALKGAGEASLKKFVDQRLTDENNVSVAKEGLYDAKENFAIVFSVQRETLYDDLQGVYDDMSSAITTKTNVQNYFNGDAEAAAYVWAAQATVFADFQKVNKYIYVWKGSTVDKVVDLWVKATAAGIGTKYQAGTSTGKELVRWINDVLQTSSTGTPALETYQDELDKLEVTILNASDLFEGYNEDQIKACADK